MRLNVIPVMFCCASGAVGWCGGDVTVCKAGLTNIALARLGGPFEVLLKQTRRAQKSVLLQITCSEESFRQLLPIVL